MVVWYQSPGQPLPSGNRARYYIGINATGLFNPHAEQNDYITLAELARHLRTSNPEQLSATIATRLALRPDEAHDVCMRILADNPLTLLTPLLQPAFN